MQAEDRLLLKKDSTELEFKLLYVGATLTRRFLSDTILYGDGLLSSTHLVPGCPCTLRATYPLRQTNRRHSSKAARDQL